MAGSKSRSRNLSPTHTGKSLQSRPEGAQPGFHIKSGRAGGSWRWGPGLIEVPWAAFADMVCRLPASRRPGECLQSADSWAQSPTLTLQDFEDGSKGISTLNKLLGGSETPPSPRTQRKRKWKVGRKEHRLPRQTDAGSSPDLAPSVVQLWARGLVTRALVSLPVKRGPISPRRLWWVRW